MVSHVPRRSFDRRANRWSVGLLLLFVSAICVLIAVDGTVMRPSLLGRILWSGAALILVLIAFAYMRQRLIADEYGVHVRNLTSTFSVRWHDIDHFEPPPPHRSRESIRRSGLGIITVDGRRLQVSLWSQARYNRPGFANGVVEELTHLKSAFD